MMLVRACFSACPSIELLCLLPLAGHSTSSQASFALHQLTLRDGLPYIAPQENKPEYREQLRSTGHFGAGYVLSRLPVLAAARDKGQREARARMLAWMGHLLKLQAK